MLLLLPARAGRLGPRVEDAAESVPHRLLEYQEAMVLALLPRVSRRCSARSPSAVRPACGVQRVVSLRSAPLAVSAFLCCVLDHVILWSREENLHPVHSKTAAEPIRTEPAGAADILPLPLAQRCGSTRRRGLGDARFLGVAGMAT